MGEEMREVMYKTSVLWLRKMQDLNLISEEECTQIDALNISFFQPEFSKVYL